MADLNRKQITVVLSSKDKLVPLSSFNTALDQLTILLHEVSREASESKPHRIIWGIARLSLDSPAKISLESIEEEDEGIAQLTTFYVIEGLQILQKERTRPKYFNDAALESAERLVRLAKDGLSSINVYSDAPNQQILLSEQIAINISSILEHLEYYGSTEGTLEIISGREGQPLYFGVHDRVNNKSVKCFIPNELLDKAFLAFRKRVIVMGNVKSDNNGIPRNIRVQDIEIAPDEKSLPQAEDILRHLENGTLKIQPYEHSEP